MMRTFRLEVSLYSHKEGDPPWVTTFEGLIAKTDLGEKKARNLFDKIKDITKIKTEHDLRK